MTTNHTDDTRRSGETCPRCLSQRLRAWSELSDDERTVVERLPASAEYSLDERTARHRWCTRCWHEATRPAPHDA